MKQEKRAMRTLKKLALFFGCNVIGFFLPPILYHFSLATRIIDINAENFDLSGFYLGATQISNGDPIYQPVMVLLPILTWIICSLFSFSFFFVGKKWERFFLLAPLLLPVLQSLIIMLKYI